MYKEQFDVESLKIIFNGDAESFHNLQQSTHIEIIAMPPVELNDIDYHPTAEGIKKLVDFLFSSKLIN